MEPVTSFSVDAFAVWAAIVGLIGAAIVYELFQLRGDVKEMSKNLANHILHTERRVTHTETFLGLKHSDYQPISRDN